MQRDPSPKPPTTEEETLIIHGAKTLAQPQPEVAAHHKYELISPLGKGGFAWVYLVKNLDLNRLEAIKILAADMMEEDVLNRFVKEAQISANFNHQNIVTIYEVRKNGSWSDFKASADIQKRHKEPFTYFTMSYVEGMSGAQLLKKEGALPLKRVLSIGMDIAAALEYAHRKNVIHRDIKPENVLIDRQGRGIVMDFGIAKAQDQTRRTAAGTFMGTARYVSPEQAMGKDIDGRSDLYSLGVTLYELAVGRAPFDSDNWMTVLYQHINEAPPPIDSLKADLDRDFQTILYRLLEKKPEDRLQNAKACHTALKRVFQNLGGTDYATEALDNIETRADPKPRFPQPSQPATPPVRKRVLHPQQPSPEESSTPPHRRLAPVLALLSLFALAAVAFWLWPEGTTPPPPTFPTHVTAFPSGDLVSLISDQQGAIPLIKSKLPLLLDLPEGTYTATWRFGNDTLERTVVVRSGTINTWHMNFVAFSSEQFLLEDLQ